HWIFSKTNRRRWWFVDIVERLGHHAILSNPKQTNAIAAARLKNAILLILELGEIQRFPSAKHLASYVGLTPRVRASANRVRLGHISKEGNRLLRWALVVAATQAARRPGPLRAWFRAVQQRKGMKIARVALARRLAEIV